MLVSIFDTKRIINTLLFLSLFFTESCAIKEEEDEEKSKLSGTGDVKVSMKDVESFDDSEAIDFFKNTCGSCHQDGLSAVDHWSMGGNFSKESFGSDPMAPVVFQALYKSVIDSLYKWDNWF